MHIHIQNDTGITEKPITPDQWDAAGIPGHHVTYGRGAEAFMAEAATVEVLIAPPWEIKRLDLFAAPHLKMVQSTSAGVDTLQPFERIPAHVVLTNNRGTHAAKAGEYSLMAILMLVNTIPRFVTYQRAEHWQREASGLAREKRLTVVGLGALGGAAAAQAKYLGMHVTGVSHAGAAHAACDAVLPSDGLDAVLPDTDILLLACPLTPATQNLLSRERIARLPAGAGVINIGRGRLVDEDALLDALETGRLGGAVLDVLHKEPLPPGHRAWSVKNLIITPHVSSDDPSTYNALTLQIFKKNLAALIAGDQPPTAVDRQKGY
jgi:phosphoglycerate dehydrogenase-like enzyme